MKREKAQVLKAEDYRAILLAKRAELTRTIGLVPPSLTELGSVADDQAPILHDHFVSLQLKQLDRQRLKQVDAALERLANGDFGICTECGGNISSKRLAAIPWADYCIACQELVGSARAPAGTQGQAA